MSEQDPKQNLREKVEQTAESVDYTPFEQRVQTAATNVGNSIETTIGRTVGDIKGGVESITSEVEGAIDKLNNTTTEGLLTDATKSFDNFKNDAINSAVSAIASRFGAKVNITFSDPDSNGISSIESASLEPDGGLSATISGILQLITGLGTGGLQGQALQDAIQEGATDLQGELQQQVIDGAAEGIVDAVARVEGKVGAFASKEALKEATDSLVNTVLDNVPATGDVNQVQSYPDSAGAIDSDGFGNVTTTLTAIANPNLIVPSLEDSAMRLNLITNTQNDLENTMKAVTSNASGLVEDLSEISGGKDGETVKASVENKDASITAVETQGQEYTGLIRRVSGSSSRGNVQALSIDANPEVIRDLQVTAPTLTPEEIDQVIDLAQSGDEDKISQADIVKAKSTVSYDNILEQIRAINTTITENNKLIENYQVFAEPYVIGSSANSFNGGRGNPDFPYVSSVEELNAEFQNISRTITSMIVHWTETHTNRNIGSEEINDYHLDLGIAGIGYHYVIRRDGSIQRGRPVNQDGEHTPDFNTGSIGVVFVGGINAPSGTDNSENFVSAQSLTRTQINSFDHLCRAFLNRFDDGYIFGHNDLDEDEFDPGFDVIEYVKSRFDVADYSVEDL